MSILSYKDSKNFSYLIGLIAADGFIHPTGPAVHISSSPKDISARVLLESIEKYFGGSTRLYNSDRRWGIYERSFKNFMLKIGFTPNKSKTLNIKNWFETLSEEQKWAFLTGVIDGDGCIRSERSKITNNMDATLSFVSASKSFTDMLYEFINQPKAKLKCYTTKNGTNMYHISAYCGNIPKVFPNLYQTELGLSRKKEKYFQIIEHYKNKKPYTWSEERKTKNAQRHLNKKNSLILL